MRPTQSDVHVNRPLSNILIAFMQDDSKAIARRAFPVVPVAHKSDVYYRWKRGDFFRISVTERAPGTESEGGAFDLDTDSYNCKEFAIHKNIEDPIRDNADSELDLDEASVRYIGQQLTLKREKFFTTTFMRTGLWTGTTNNGDLTGVPGAPAANQFRQWDQLSSTPIEDLRKLIVGMEEKTGYRPNKIILGPHVWRILQDHPELLDRIKFTQKGVITQDLIAALLGIDEILIGSLIENTGKEGQADTFSFIHGRSALLIYAPARPSLMEPSAGYIFAWTKRFGNGPEGQRIKKFRMEAIEADRIEGQMNFDMKVVSTELGAYLDQVVSNS